MKKAVKDNLDFLLGKPVSISQKFHDKTKITKFKKQNKSKDWPGAWKVVFFKEYPRLDKIILNEPLPLTKPIGTVLKNRTSSRDFSPKLISLEKISSLLYYSAGLKDTFPPYQGKRTYPSAGARYPIEIYVISIKSELNKSIYHYNVRSHSFEVLQTFKKFNISYYFNQVWVQNSGILVLLTADFDRNMMKYGYRGYRHILVESGHVGQNLYLVSAALDLGICEIGEYREDRLDELFEIDGVNESVIGAFAVGMNKTK